MPRKKNSRKSKAKNYLILFRHGDSRWNRANRFTGWVDVPLSEVGIYECLISSEKLEGLRLDVAFCSELIRSMQSLYIILAKQNYTGIYMHPEKKFIYKFHHRYFHSDEIPIYSSSNLNERYYGDLQGMDKDTARRKFGEEQVFAWRRGWNVKPPKGESLKDTYKRVIPYFNNSIMPYVKQGKNVIVSAHGNSLRAIIKHIENISEDDIPHLSFPTGQISIYTFEKNKFLHKDVIYSFDRPVHWKKSAKEQQVSNISIKL